MPKGMLIKGCVLVILEWRINLDITSHLLDEIAQMHAVGDGLDTTFDNLNQVLEDQGR